MKTLTKHIIHGSRLIYIYLITVLLAGTILSYLSFNNISNFEELTEKRILEEERTIHALYSSEFNKMVQLLADSLDAQTVNRDNVLNQSFSPLVKDYLIMTKNGALIRPHFSDIGSSVEFSKNRTEFTEAIAQAEPLEFMSERYEAAEAAYKKALSLAKSSNDTSKVYNALIRLCVKQERWIDAFNLYEQLIRNYGMAENEFGFPYVYLSFDVLVNSGNVDFESRREELITLFLTQLMENKIAFTGNTGELLQNIASNTNIILKDTLKVLLNHVFERQQTLEDYRPLISRFLDGSDDSDYIELGSAKVINSEKQEDEILMLIEHEEYNLGYVITLKELDNVLLKTMDFNGFRFEYDLILSRATLNPIDAPDNTNINRRFSTLFPNMSLLVQPKNPSQVREFIFRRTLITIIGLGLLLLAMVIGLLILIRDVSRKKQMEKLRADFVANVTHELKTPLTSINMFADSILLDRVKTRENLQKYAEIIVKESEKLKRMVNNILEFSRQEVDKMSYNLKEENLEDIIHAVMDEMQYWLTSHGFEVELDLEDKLKALVDAEGLKQVLSNLITNAIKYSPDHKRIAIRTYSFHKMACIDVEDHGIGIAANQLKSVFKKFYRVTDNDFIVSGTGLGLTVSKEIIEAMNGKLTVKSEPKQGSVFTIYLKRASHEA